MHSQYKRGGENQHGQCSEITQLRKCLLGLHTTITDTTMATGRRPSDNWDWPLGNNDGLVALKNDSRLFEADLDVQNFKPNEIDVKVMNDELVLHCYKDQGPGRTPREIHRTYKLPADVDLHSLKSNVKNDGKLQITASKKKF